MKMIAMNASRLSMIFGAALLWAGCRDIYADPLVYNEVFDNRAATSDPSRSSTSGGSGGPFAPASVCPPERPYDDVECGSGSAGASSAGSCEYGSNVDAWCNTRVECTGTKWSTRHEPPACDPCPAEDQVVEGASCGEPAVDDAGAEAGPIDGGDAGPAPRETLCGYPTRTCACTVSGGRQKWVCTETPKDCPAARPLEGHPCTVQQTCSYGGCVSPLGLTMTCTGTFWAIATTECK